MPGTIDGDARTGPAGGNELVNAAEGRAAASIHCQRCVARFASCRAVSMWRVSCARSARVAGVTGVAAGWRSRRLPRSSARRRQAWRSSTSVPLRAPPDVRADPPDRTRPASPGRHRRSLREAARRSLCMWHAPPQCVPGGAGGEHLGADQHTAATAASPQAQAPGDTQQRRAEAPATHSLRAGNRAPEERWNAFLIGLHLRYKSRSGTRRRLAFNQPGPGHDARHLPGA